MSTRPKLGAYLTDPSLVIAYLASNPAVPPEFQVASSVEQLSGGLSNFVYHLRLSDGVSPPTAVLKHTTQFSASVPDFKMEVSRWDVEHACLANKALLEDTKTPFVRVPELYFADSEMKVLIMEDGGEVSLKGLLMSGELSNKLMDKLGRELGIFLANLHSSTSTLDQAGKMKVKSIYEESIESAAAREMCVQRSFGRIKSTLDAWNPPYRYNTTTSGTEQELEELAETMRKKIMKDGQCAVFGDFWSSNILVRLKEGVAELDAIYIIDWEWVHPGDPGTDVGQMTAELFCFHHFKKSTRAEGLARSFHKAYYETAKPDDSFRAKVMIYAGGDVATWVCSLEWWSESSEKVRDIAEKGMEMLWQGYRGATGEGFCEALRR